MKDLIYLGNLYELSGETRETSSGMNALIIQFKFPEKEGLHFLVEWCLVMVMSELSGETRETSSGLNERSDYSAHISW